eukprot:5632126-Amphidinium_carterae.1
MSTAAQRHPSIKVQKLAQELLKLAPDELKILRQACRERLIPKRSMQAKAPKEYNPVLKVLRSDRPLPVRAALHERGMRLAGLHPKWVFAGSGPGVQP